MNFLKINKFKVIQNLLSNLLLLEMFEVVDFMNIYICCNFKVVNLLIKNINLMILDQTIMYFT